MSRVFSPYVELFWKRIPASLEEIKKAGFDGVECHLIGGLRSTKRVLRLREEVEELGLGISFHQGWSWQTGQRNLYNLILRPLGALVPFDMTIQEQVDTAGADKVVVYGNLVDYPYRANYIYQTASEHVDGRSYAMTFERFVSIVKALSCPLVFDTQHALEWFFNKESVVGLPTDQESLIKTVGRLWQDFCPYVREIHLCDFNPDLGPARGRNLFPGNGVFPLGKFCADVRATGWKGIVVPEVAPQHLRGKDSLRLLREKVDQLFH